LLRHSRPGTSCLRSRLSLRARVPRASGIRRWRVPPGPARRPLGPPTVNRAKSTRQASHQQGRAGRQQAVVGAGEGQRSSTVVGGASLAGASIGGVSLAGGSVVRGSVAGGSVGCGPANTGSRSYGAGLPSQAMPSPPAWSLPRAASSARPRPARNTAHSRAPWPATTGRTEPQRRARPRRGAGRPTAPGRREPALGQAAADCGLGDQHRQAHVGRVHARVGPPVLLVLTCLVLTC
jgi:hypothetical protein